MTTRRAERTLPIPAAPRGYSPIAAAVLAAVGGQAALAQDNTGLEEVVVTAQKRSNTC